MNETTIGTSTCWHARTAADRLVGLCERQRCHHVDVGVCQPSKLGCVILLGFARGDGHLGCVGITAGADETVQDDGLGVVGELQTDAGDECNCVMVDAGEVGFARSKRVSPVKMGFPGLTVEHEAGADVASQRQETAKVVGERFSPGPVVNKGVCAANTRISIPLLKIRSVSSPASVR